jgi:NTE family protein
VRKIILVAVNSERDTSERIDKADHVPSTSQVMDSLLFGAGARATQETLALLNDDARRWSREIAQQRGSPDSPFAADAEFYVVSVSLRDVPDSNLRQAVLQVPTAFTVTPAQVSQLKEAGRAALRESAEFQRLRRGLGAAQSSSVAGPDVGAIR